METKFVTSLFVELQITVFALYKYFNAFGSIVLILEYYSMFSLLLTSNR